MWEVVSASPSTGLSSGRRSSLGPLSEREQRELESHAHHLLHPVPPVRPGRWGTAGWWALTLEHGMVTPRWEQGPRFSTGTPPRLYVKRAGSETMYPIRSGT